MRDIFTTHGIDKPVLAIREAIQYTNRIIGALTSLIPGK